MSDVSRRRTCQAAGEHPLHPASLEQRRKPGRRLAVRLDEGGIGIDSRVHALAQDEEREVDRKVRVQLRAWRPLHAMVVPQGLIAKFEPLRLERLRAFVG